MMKTSHKAWLAAAATSLLVACGGGGGDDAAPAPTEAVPESASRSEDGLVAYLGDLVASMADAAEALDLGAFLPPTSEDGEPVEVD